MVYEMPWVNKVWVLRSVANVDLILLHLDSGATM